MIYMIFDLSTRHRLTPTPMQIPFHKPDPMKILFILEGFESKGGFETLWTYSQSFSSLSHTLIKTMFLEPLMYALWLLDDSIPESVQILTDRLSLDFHTAFPWWTHWIEMLLSPFSNVQPNICDFFPNFIHENSVWERIRALILIRTAILLTQDRDPQFATRLEARFGHEMRAAWECVIHDLPRREMYD